MLWIQKLSSNRFLTQWNIAFSTSPKFFLRRPELRLCVLGVIVLLETLLKRLRQKRCFECPEWRKCGHMYFRHHETSFHRHHQSRILRRSQGRLWVLRNTRLLRTSLKQLRPNRFFQSPQCTKSVRMVFVQQWNIDSSTTRKSNFKTFTNKIMIS
jgi:hypothetical protein